jgi:hypothetical protein
VTPDDAFAELTDRWVGQPGVQLKRMMSSPGLTIDGSIFAMLTRGQLVVKLPAERVGELVAAGDGVPFSPRADRPMREWVVLTASPDVERWEALAQEAFGFVTSLPKKR